MAKNAATEGDVGRIHKMVTDIYTLQLGSMLAEMQKDPKQCQYMGDLNTIKAAAKWCESNDIKSVLPTEESGNELKAKLVEIKQFSKPVDPTIKEA
jgi:hypothetical protein